MIFFRQTVWISTLFALLGCVFTDDTNQDPRRHRVFRWGLVEGAKLPEWSEHPQLSAVELTRFDSAAVAIEAFHKGELDVLEGIPEAFHRQVAAMKGAHWLRQGKWWAIFPLSLRANPDALVFRAVRAAVDRREFTRLVHPSLSTLPLSDPAQWIADLNHKDDPDFSASDATRWWRSASGDRNLLRFAILDDREQKKAVHDAWENLRVQLNRRLGVRVELSAAADFVLRIDYTPTEWDKKNSERIIWLGERVRPILVRETVTDLEWNRSGRWDLRKTYWSR